MSSDAIKVFDRCIDFIESNPYPGSIDTSDWSKQFDFGLLEDQTEARCGSVVNVESYLEDPDCLINYAIKRCHETTYARNLRFVLGVKRDEEQLQKKEGCQSF